MVKPSRKIFDAIFQCALVKDCSKCSVLEWCEPMFIEMKKIIDKEGT